MHNCIKLCTLLLGIFCSSLTSAQVWEFVGPRNIAGTSVSFPVMTSDANGTSYLLYIDNANGGRASVSVWNGSNWNFVGPRGFSNAPVSQNSDITVDADGNVWVVIVGDLNADNNLEVWKFDGSNWIDESPPVQRSGIEPKIKFLNNDIYLEISERIGFQNGISVLKYENGSWSYIGGPHLVSGFGWPGNIAFHNGEPYVSYLQFSGQIALANVRKYDGNSWVQVGNADFSTASGGGAAWVQDIEFSESGELFIGYYDQGGNDGLNVMKLENGLWVQVGPVNFARTFSLDLEFVGDTPFIAFQDLDAGGVSVRTFDGTDWQNIGDPVITPSQSYNASLEIFNGNMRVSFVDAGMSNGASVMQYQLEIAAPIPTMSQWMLFILGLIMTSLAVVYIKKQQWTV